jgi:Ca2+:H+ antiporter
MEARVQSISRIISLLLIISYGIFTFFQTRTHHGIYNDVFEEDDQRDAGRDEERHSKEKLTMTESLIALGVSVALVTLMAITLVHEIEPILNQSSVTDPFMGLILVPFVEKFAEHLSAINKAWDDRMNFALSHVLGSTLQTALFNAPLTVIVGWGLHKNMDLDFDIFNLVMLILSILTVGRFLQDQKSNYLEGSLLVILYIAVAVAAYHTPNPGHTEDSSHAGKSTGH